MSWAITAKDTTTMTKLTAIDPTFLESVTGGATPKQPPTGSSNNSALLGQLSSLQSSIKDLATQKPQSAFGGANTMLLFCALAMSRPAPAATNVVYVRRGYW
jgi:hypothetical protein